MTITRFFLVGLCALALGGTAARAADFDGPYPPYPDGGGYEHRPLPPPPDEAFPRPRFTAGAEFGPPPEACRVFVKRRFDADGEEVVRRVRVCDEPTGYEAPRHRSAFFNEPPRPPADIPPHHWDGPYGPRW